MTNRLDGRASVLISGLLGSLLFCTANANAVEWRVLPNTAHHLELTETANEIGILTTGNDPYLTGRCASVPSPKDVVLEIEYFSSTGVQDFSAILGPPINELRRVELPPVPIAEGWHKYSADLSIRFDGGLPKNIQLVRFDFGIRPDTRIRLKSVRMRPRTREEVARAERAAMQRVAKLKLADDTQTYLASQNPSPIHVISVSDSHIHIGVIRDTSKPTRLLEFRPNHDHAADSRPLAVTDAEIAAGTTNSAIYRVPRMSDGHDRIFSSWQVELDGVAEGARRYITATELRSDRSKPRLRPRNQKGLTGFSARGPRQDLVDLDIASVTMNLPITRLLSHQKGPGRIRIPVKGSPVYFNEPMLASFDPLLSFCDEHKVVVSAIVLIPAGSHRAGARRSPLLHPETDGGTYAMPDMTTERGTRIYSYIINAVAKRYSDGDESPGSITNWIAHNEIDFHTVWTNMGKQPPALLTETYYRSMRLIHNIAKQHNPNAHVFASLTHHWNVSEDLGWHRLSPKQFLLDVQRYSQLEGDFDWGVAYHPYPQSLFAKVAWEDKHISDNFDTPLITMQNLQVLGRFLKQPSMLSSRGLTRPVILSEQGFHTDSYDAEAQNRQAGSLYWAMSRVREMPWVESFIYHRWIDHRDEGGLMLGLRTLPTNTNRFGEKKRAWHVYRAFGTDKESIASEGLPQP